MKSRTTAHALPLVILLLGVKTQARSSVDLMAVEALDETLLNVKDTTTEQAKDKSSGNESVVQDWNLVCEELCRAGLGGPPCAPQCNILTQTYRETITDAADLLLGDATYDLCSILCAYDLGVVSCRCSNHINILKDQLNRDTICKAFCMLRNITIAGCSRCSSQTYHPVAPRTTTIASTKTNNEDGTGKISGSKTIQSLAVDSSVQQTTTPDWNEVCLSLCKIGEGGSLCNCDLPPLF